MIETFVGIIEADLRMIRMKSCFVDHNLSPKSAKNGIILNIDMLYIGIMVVY